MEQGEINFALNDLEEVRWRIRSLIKSEEYPEYLVKRFQSLYNEVCDLEDEFKSYLEI